MRRAGYDRRMKVRAWRIVALVLAGAALLVAATGSIVWVPYLRAQSLRHEVKRRGGTLLLGRCGPDWLVTAVARLQRRKFLRYFDTRVRWVSFEGCQSVGDDVFGLLIAYPEIEEIDLSRTAVT